MFLLARSWGFGPWGRWFAGLTFPFCGFLIVWLLFPVTSVAIWMPWLFWASDRVLDRPPAATGSRALAVVGAASLLGGHIQTSAHVLLAAGRSTAPGGSCAGRSQPQATRGRRQSVIAQRVLGTRAGCSGLVLGDASRGDLAAGGAILGRSPVWEDRAGQSSPSLALARPRMLDTSLHRDSLCVRQPAARASQPGAGLWACIT